MLKRAKGLKGDLKTLKRATRGGLKDALKFKPGPMNALDVATGWHKRTVRIRHDGRRDKKWRSVRDKILRPLLPGPVKLLGRLFGRRR